MNAVGLSEQENGRAIGFYCGKCGRAQLPMFCQQPVTVVGITELHRKAEACCTVTTCAKHERMLYNGAHCEECIAEGPEGAEVKNPEAIPQPTKTAKRTRKAAT